MIKPAHIAPRHGEVIIVIEKNNFTVSGSASRTTILYYTDQNSKAIRINMTFEIVKTESI